MRLLRAVLLLAVAAGSSAAQGKIFTHEDLVAWKSIRATAVSPDGRWFAALIAPNEGDAEVVVRPAGDGAERRFPVGEPPAGPFTLAFSGSGRYVVFQTYPTAKEARRLRTQRRAVVPSATLVEVASGATREFDRVRAVRFAADRSDVLVVHHAAPDAGGGGGATGSAGAPSTPPQPAPAGAPLSILSPQDSVPTVIAGVVEFALDRDGGWIAYAVDGRDGPGGSVHVRAIASGTTRTLDAGKGFYRRLTWADSGAHLAVIRGVADSAGTDTAWAVLAWRGVDRTPRRAALTGDGVTGWPAGMEVSPERNPRVSDDGAAVFIGLRTAAPPPPKSDAPPVTPGPGAPAPGAGAGGSVAPAPQDEDTPSLILWHWKDPRLQSAQQVQEAQDKAFSYLAAWRPDDQRVVRLADDSIRSVTLAPGDRWAVGQDITPYEREANLRGVARRDVYAIDVMTGTARRIARGITTNSGFGPAATAAFSPRGDRFAWYDGGHYFVTDLASGATRNVTEGVPTRFWNEEDDHNIVRPALAGLGWSKDGTALVLRDNWDLWKVPVAGGPAVNLTVNGRRDRIRYQQRVGVPPRERGIDLSQPLYVETYGERTKKEGLVRVVAAAPAQNRVLAWEDAKVDFTRARDADRWFFTRQTFTTFPDWWVADGALGGQRRLTDANPQQREFAWSAGARLVDYVSEKGDTLQAALFLPAGYEPGRSYPTLTYIYEKLSQTLHVYATPNATRYAHPAVYTNRGYAVLMPDIVYTLDDPGRSAVWCVVPAVKAAIATGIVDPANVGLQGHSWGGYQTSFITTQTDLFKTAVAGAPLTDMVSMFSSVYWNTGSANQPIFISSQGRFTSGFADNPEAYLRNSPNRYAKNLKIPFMILHNERDGAVDFNQGITYFNTLRELGKEVVLLQYVGENHGLARRANQVDYAERMLEWYDHFLRGAPAPAWLTDGIPRLKMADHLREKATARTKKPIA